MLVNFSSRGSDLTLWAYLREGWERQVRFISEGGQNAEEIPRDFTPHPIAKQWCNARALGVIKPHIYLYFKQMRAFFFDYVLSYNLM